MGTALPSATGEAVGAENISHSGKDKYAASLALLVVAKQVPLSGNTREMRRLNQPFFMRFRIKLLIFKLHEPFVLDRFCQVWKIVASGSLPLIVLNVVIHVIGLGLINESVVRLLSGAMERRRFLAKFAVVMGVTALLATVLHGIEAATWAGAYQLLGALSDTKSAMLYSLSAMTSYGHANLFLKRALATDGPSWGAKRDASLRADHRFFVHHDSEGLAAGKQRAAPGA
jgi:hypothetical protein